MKITVDNEAHQYVTECVRAVSGEVGGLGYIELVEQNHLHISEFVLLKQKASFASVDFDDKSFIDEITRAAEEDKEDMLRCSWHSHGSMETYFSTTDEKGVLEYAELKMPWLVSLVYNHKGDIASRIDVFDSEPIAQITISDLDYQVVNPQKVRDRARHDVKKFVNKPTSKSTGKPKGKQKPWYERNRYEDSGYYYNNQVEGDDEPLSGKEIIQYEELYGEMPGGWFTSDDFDPSEINNSEELYHPSYKKYLRDEFGFTEEEVEELLTGADND